MATSASSLVGDSSRLAGRTSEFEEHKGGAVEAHSGMIACAELVGRWSGEGSARSRGDHLRQPAHFAARSSSVRTTLGRNYESQVDPWTRFGASLERSFDYPFARTVRICCIGRWSLASTSRPEDVLVDWSRESVA